MRGRVDACVDVWMCTWTRRRVRGRVDVDVDVDVWARTWTCGRVRGRVYAYVDVWMVGEWCVDACVGGVDAYVGGVGACVGGVDACVGVWTGGCVACGPCVGAC